LTAVAITAMALGIIRIGWAVSMLALPKLLAFETKMLRGAVRANELGTLQRESLDRLATLSAAFVEAHLGLTIGVAGLAAMLIIGGVGCLQLRPRFRLAAMVGFLGLLATDAALATDEVSYQRVVKDETDRLSARTMELTGQGQGQRKSDGALRTISSFSKSMETTSLYVTVGWMALRMVICAGGFATLARASTKRLFEPATNPIRV
jgi:hypothetical protein